VKPSHQPGDAVIWFKRLPGGDYVCPCLAKVRAVTAKRVTIEVDDPDETGSGLVVRHVAPESLQPHKPADSRSPSKHPSLTRAVKKQSR
jgi:hypothetical protein